MAVSQVELLNQTFTNAIVTANGTYDLFVGSSQSNNNNLPSLRAVIEFSNFNPVEAGSVNPSYAITALIEGTQNGVWYPVAYQFEPYKGNSGNGNQRIVILQPGLSTFDAGIDDIVWVGDATIARISRQQGKLGPSYRLRLVLKETGYGTANAFVAGTIKVVAELHDAI